MAKKFGDTRGTALKGIPSFEYKDNENKVRLVGDVLARYVYWVKADGGTGKDIPIECLSFNRDEERFDNKEVDHVPTYFPGKKCQWNYSILCIDPKDNKVKVMHLKKKLFEQIINASEDLGDPTDAEKGWTVVFKKTKSGPLPINVSYDLQVLRCKPQPLTAEELAAIEEFGNIDSHYKRPTPEEIKALCEKVLNGGKDKEESTEDALTSSESEAVNELDSDIPM